MAPRFPSFPSAYGKVENADGTPSPEWVTFLDDLRAYVRAPAMERKTVATLPVATTSFGLRYFVTDATATTFMSIVAGGGANGVPVFSDGGVWRIG